VANADKRGSVATVLLPALVFIGSVVVLNEYVKHQGIPAAFSIVLVLAALTGGIAVCLKIRR